MKNHKKITKAVIATAGNATRFLPATKNQPKQMLPIIDKPIIQYLVEEAVESGITDIILVTQAGQHAMEDYFDNNMGLEYALESIGKEKHLQMIRDIPQMANFIYVRQKKHMPYGNATPLLVAENLIDDDESFVYMYGDDLTISANGTPVTKQMIDIYEKYQPTAVMAVQETPTEELVKYGTVKYKSNPEVPNQIDGCLEKMPLGQSPSNMVSFGRFVFSYDVVRQAKQTKPGLGNELWNIDVINELAKQGKTIIAQPIEGKWLDTGNPVSYIKATITYALQRDDVSGEVKKYLQTLNI